MRFLRAPKKEAVLDSDCLLITWKSAQNKAQINFYNFNYFKIMACCHLLILAVRGNSQLLTTISLFFFSFFYRNKRENSFHQTKWRFSLSLTLALTFTVSTSSGDLWSPLSEVLLNVPQALLLAQARILISMIVYHIWYDIYDSSIRL